ncbi:hypothetical protein TD95_000116 [Thielaviopsis punctulata]|uniref:non-specific serine/threonine protein kinase n=1 Tax=Thielaviopsis punctulata TaxID=72032 RepID=A0A0F4Z7E8_9PEZI|nr:hypothetical protein TD95_000116 [Thielaviopsis punctulata]
MATSGSTVTKAEEYEILDKIGHGSFGIIHRVRRKADGLVLCRKEINYLKMSQKEREQLHAEFTCLSHLRHPNIVAYYHREHLKDTQELHLYMEYCGNGDLGRVIKDLASRGQRASESFVWTIFSQLTSALYTCHYGINPPSPSEGGHPGKAPAGTMCIMHRDLKPENVFLGENNSVKLGDFGLSKMIKSQDFASTYVGTPYYMSPEICAAERYTLKSDIWSLGCIMYELCMRAPPFDARSHYQLVQKIKEGQPSPLPSLYSPELREAINACLRKSPDARPSTHDLLHLPQIRLTRREMELSDLKRTYKGRMEVLSQKEKELAEIAASMEAEKKVMRQEIDTQVRREWEVKAEVEINRHINMEIESLKKQFELEVRNRVEAELKKRDILSESLHRSSLAPAAELSANKSIKFTSNDMVQSMVVEPPTSTSTSSNPKSLSTSSSTSDGPSGGVNKRSLSTPSKALKRAQTMYAGSIPIPTPETPSDIEMASPSPRTISGLSLSPRRRSAIKPLETTNIFHLNRAANMTGSSHVSSNNNNNNNNNVPCWDLPRDASHNNNDSDGDNDGHKNFGMDAPPSPTQAIHSSKNPFTSKHRPSLPTSARAGLSKGPSLSSKTSNPDLSRMPPPPPRRMSKIPSVSNLAVGKTSSGSSGSSGSDGGNAGTSVSPNRLSSGGYLTKKTLHQYHSNINGADEDRPAKVLSKTNVIGRTRSELQKARAGGRPLPALMHQQKSASRTENMSPKRAFRERLSQTEAATRRSSDPPVWDPEVDEMPSPFLQKTRQVRA